MLKIRILGVPLDLGQERRGVDMGPSAVRAAGLNHALESLGHTVEDGGNVHVRLPEEQPFGNQSAKYLKEIAETSQEVAERTCQALEAGYFPVTLGGDHSMAIGTQAGVAKYFHDRNQDVGCLWIDAHADMNTPETSPSGNVHGMPFAASLGHGPESLTHLFGFSQIAIVPSQRAPDLHPRLDEPTVGQRAEHAPEALEELSAEKIDERAVDAQIDEATKAAAEMHKLRVGMVLRVRALLTPEQRQKLEEHEPKHECTKPGATGAGQTSGAVGEADDEDHEGSDGWD